MASTVLAITVGNDTTKISEVMYSSHRIVRVSYSNTIPTPKDCVEDGQIRDPKELATAIRDELRKGEIITKDVIFAIQSNKIISKEIVAPYMKEARLMEYIVTNATEYFPVNIDEYVFTYSILENIIDVSEKKYRLMVMAAPMGIVERYYDVADMLELRVLDLDYVGNSTLQLMRLQIDDSPTLSIQMGDEATIISIFNKNVLQLMRSVPYGRSTVANAIAEKRDISYEEALTVLDNERVLKESFSDGDYITGSLKYLANNISRVIDYYSTKNPDVTIQKAVMVTEGKSIRALETLLSYEIGLKIKKIDELNQVIADDRLNMSLSELTGYLSNIGCVIQPVNFVPKSALIKAKKTNDNKYLRLIIMGAVFIAAVIVLIPLVGNISKRTENNGLKSNIKKIEGIKTVVNDYYLSKDKFTDISTFYALASNADDDLHKFIEFLEENMPSDIGLTSFSVSGGAVTMNCTGSSKETLAQFLVTLKKQSNISSVNCASVSEATDDNDAITDSYTITCVFSQFPTQTEEGDE